MTGRRSFSEHQNLVDAPVDPVDLGVASAAWRPVKSQFARRLCRGSLEFEKRETERVERDAT